MNNLIICTSPLQVFIANRIMQEFPDEGVDFILLSKINNEKYQYYFNFLKKKCDRSIFLTSYSLGARDLLGYTLNIIKCMFFLKRKYNKIFIASIDDSLIHNILSLISFSLLYTFDDGTINISDNNVYKDDRYVTTSKFYVLFKHIFHIKYSIKRIKAETKKHFTIYQYDNNIVKNTLYISLFEKIESKLENKKVEEISILLGQNVLDSDVRNINLIKTVIEKYNIDYYYPHPKETYVIDKVKYIKSELIFEDFIKGINSNIVLYTFFSSAALNVKEMDNIKVFSLMPKNIVNQGYLDCYSIFEKSGIPIIHLDI